MFAVKFPVDCEPDVPLQPPGETEHVVAFAEVHVMFAAVLYVMVIGPSEAFALMSAVGGAGATFTVTDALAEPEGPEQFTVYVVVAVRLPDVCVPEVPVQFGGETVQELA